VQTKPIPTGITFDNVTKTVDAIVPVTQGVLLVDTLTNYVKRNDLTATTSNVKILNTTGVVAGFTFNGPAATMTVATSVTAGTYNFIYSAADKADASTPVLFTVSYVVA